MAVGPEIGVKEVNKKEGVNGCKSASDLTELYTSVVSCGFSPLQACHNGPQLNCYL